MNDIDKCEYFSCLESCPGCNCSGEGYDAYCSGLCCSCYYGFLSEFSGIICTAPDETFDE